MTHYLDGPDELERLEFMSRQQLLKEDKILRDKINNYVQLVNALTGEEVMLPADTDEYSFVSVSSEEYEELLEEESTEYVEDDDWDYESIEDEHDAAPGPPTSDPPENDNEGEGKIENMDFIQSTAVDGMPPPTPSQIIRKLKATLVQAGMEQIKLVRRKSVRRLGGNNWSYDMAKRRLNRELKRIQKRKAYRDAIETIPPSVMIPNSIEEEKAADLLSPQPASKKPAVRESTNRKAFAESKAREPRTSLSGSVFVGLLKTLEKRPTGGNNMSGHSRSSKSPKAPMSRSDQRLQAILRKHHHSLMNQKEKMQSPGPPFPSPPSAQGTSSTSPKTIEGTFPPPPLSETETDAT